MVKSLRDFIAKVSLLGLFIFPVLAPVTAVGAQGVSSEPNLQDNLCGGAEHLQFGEGGDCAEAEGATETVNNLVGTVINIFSVVVGIVAVIMIVWGGFKYITSGGDSGNITAAKNTILFAIVGLIIVAMAQIIVRFVLARATNQG